MSEAAAVRVGVVEHVNEAACMRVSLDVDVLNKHLHPHRKMLSVFVSLSSHVCRS